MYVLSYGYDLVGEWNIQEGVKPLKYHKTPSVSVIKKWIRIKELELMKCLLIPTDNATMYYLGTQDTLQ